jgi:hypothetical protein
MLEAYPGDNVEFQLTINNDGNGRGIFSVILTNHQELTSLGMLLALSQDKMEIDGRSSETLSLSVAIPDINTCIGTHSLKVEIAAEAEEADPAAIAPGTYTFTLMIEKAPEQNNKDPVDPDPPDIPEIPDGEDDDTDKSSSDDANRDIEEDSFMDTGLLVFIISVVVVGVVLGFLFARGRSTGKL